MNRDAIVARLVALPLWGPMGIDCGIRAGLRCEYCDRDLLSSLDDYKAWAQDHIVPERLGGQHTLENMAVACHSCNSAYKKAWDPRSVAGVSASREELVAVTREFVAEKRRTEQEVLAQVREIAGWSDDSGTNSAPAAGGLHEVPR